VRMITLEAAMFAYSNRNMEYEEWSGPDYVSQLDFYTASCGGVNWHVMIRTRLPTSVGSGNTTSMPNDFQDSVPFGIFHTYPR
jgi:hypothetical protein